MGKVVAKDEGITGDGGCRVWRERELEGIQVGDVCGMGEVGVGGRQRGGGRRAEGLQTEVEDCGRVCWQNVSKGNG